MSTNPFTEAKYNIFESPLWNSCQDVGKKSRILETTIENPQEYQATYNRDLFYIENYISDEVDKFSKNMYLVKMCDEYGIMRNFNNTISMPESCVNTFNNYQTDVSEPQLTLSAFSENPFYNITYSSAYLDTKVEHNDKKEMCQRYADLNQMMDDFTQIIIKFDTDEIKTKFKDEYENLLEKQDANLERRKELNKKLADFYQSETSKMSNSKMNLDSTVYTSVLWTIAATTILFYVFRKL